MALGMNETLPPGQGGGGHLSGGGRGPWTWRRSAYRRFPRGGSAVDPGICSDQMDDVLQFGHLGIPVEPNQ